ncbi:macrophage-expressed gene 1 protein [Arapaima gigas]
MMATLCIALLFILIPFWVLGLSNPTSNNLNECKKTFNLPVLESLPGSGWDILLNMDASQVMSIDYTQCKTTEDGVYLIPDQVVTVPQKSSTVRVMSEILDSWQHYKSYTASSMYSYSSYNYWSIGFSYSSGSRRLKEHQVKGHSVTARTQMRHLIYTVTALPRFTLDPVFMSRVIEIASAVENNNTRMVNYLSESLVVDYGTHVVTSVEAGALLAKEDYLYSIFVKDTDENTINKYAGINFYNSFGYEYAAGRQTHEEIGLKSYINNLTYSVMVSYGGKPYYPGMTLQAWEESIPNNLVAINRYGFLLPFVLNQNTLSDLPEPTVLKVRKAVFQAILSYYQVNTHPGCTNSSSPNYNYQANFDDQSCEGLTTNLSFGGVFLQCTPLTGGQGALQLCQSVIQTNPLTGGFNCSPPYSQTLLRMEVREQNSNQYECKEVCRSCWLFFTCCDEVCSNAYSLYRVRVESYWCYATNVSQGDTTGVLFGGLYGQIFENPLTHTTSCPNNFFPATLLTDGLKICLSLDYKLAARHSIPFGGLFSCEAGNPMAGGLSRCPDGYTQHTVDVSDGCEILVCVHSLAFSQGELPPIVIPPYTRRSLQIPNGTQTMAVFEEDGDAWVRGGSDEGWKKVSLGEAQHMMQLSSVSGASRVRGPLGMTLMLSLPSILVILQGPNAF